MSGPRRLVAVAPAKVNLGLEVVGRRADGYHELVSVLQAVSLFDRFEWTATGAPFEYTGPAGVRLADDLVGRALALAPDHDLWTGRLRVVKRIPMAAGLGGGSSDAALALRLALPGASGDELHAHAARLGADVPFFLRGGTMLASGTGTTLVRRTTLVLWFVLVTPDIQIPDKTRTLYRGLVPSDFSNGETVRSFSGTLGDTRSMPNAFTRQLLDDARVRYAYDCLGRAGGELVSISGAGPTVYVAVEHYADAARIASRVPAGAGRVVVVRSVRGGADNPVVGAMAAALRGRIR